MKAQNLTQRLHQAATAVARVASMEAAGRVEGTAGLSVNITGFGALATIGDRLRLSTRDRTDILLEVLGFQQRITRAMPFGFLEGVGSRTEVRCAIKGDTGALAQRSMLAPCADWLGRIIDPLGNPLDQQGSLPEGPTACSVRARAPESTQRGRLGNRIDLGISALDLFTTCRRGQRLGLFAGSGVGKSTLLAMLARNSDCDVVVLALVGERGREVREFLEDDLGAAGLARSVVIAATSDTSPLLRREAAYAAMTVAEYFRDQGQSVLLLMDSVTRFCLASREIGLSIGEPPATRGYPPSVFAELPRLLERAGPGVAMAGKQGSITAIFTVLVEGDDQNEPVADAVRGILDGHVVMDRLIGEAGRYPAIDVLKSLSRAVPGCLGPAERVIVAKARAVLAIYSEMADLVRLGAYKPGADPATDEAVRLAPRIEALLRQDRAEAVSASRSFAELAAIMEKAHA